MNSEAVYTWADEFDFNAEAATAKKEDEAKANPVSLGPHICRIIGTETFVSSQKGTPGLRVNFAALDKNEDGQPVCRQFDQTFWLSQKAYRLGLIPLCNAIGYRPAKGQFVHEELVGKHLEVFVKHSPISSNNGPNTINPKGTTGKFRPEIDVFEWGESHGMKSVEVTDEINQQFASFGYADEIPF